MASQTGLNHVNVKAFDGQGFSKWEYRVKLILEQRGVLAVLLTNPPTSQTELDVFKSSDKARNIIVQCLADNIFQLVKEKKTSKEMMDALRKTYQKTGLATQVQLQRKLRTISYAGEGSLNEFLIEFEKTVAELRGAGGRIENGEIITQLLSGIPEFYQAVVTAIDVLFGQDEDSVTLDFVKNKLLLEEQRQKKNKVQAESVQQHAFTVKKQNREARKAFPSQGSRYTKNDNRQGQSYVFKEKCFSCGRQGHRRYECPQKRRANVVQEEEKEAATDEITFVTEVSTQEDESDMCANVTLGLDKNRNDFVTFVVDSSATCYLVNTDVGQYLKNTKDSV